MLPVRQKPLAGTSGLVDNKASRLILDTAYDLGYRTFDTARVYAKGDSENCIGRWVKDRRIRDQVTVITKCGHPSHRNRLAPSDLEHDIDASLKALRVDCLDMVLLHRDDAAMPVGGLVTFFDARIRQGKLKAYGVSNWRLARLLEAKDFAKANTLQGPVVSSLHFSLMGQPTLARLRQPECPGRPGGTGLVCVDTVSNILLVQLVRRILQRRGTSEAEGRHEQTHLRNERESRETQARICNGERESADCGAGRLGLRLQPAAACQSHHLQPRRGALQTEP
jgi:hypothetical protein